MEKQTTCRLEASIFYLVLRFLSAVLLFQLQYNFHFLSELGHRPWKRQRRTCLECGTQGLRKQQARAAQRNGLCLGMTEHRSVSCSSQGLDSSSWSKLLKHTHVTAQSLVWELLPENSQHIHSTLLSMIRSLIPLYVLFRTLFPQPFSTDLQTFMKSWIWNNTNEQLLSWLYNISSWERNKKTRKQNH